MRKVVAVIGGSQKQTYKKIGEKYGVQILFHSGKNGSKKELQNVVKKADCCVLLLGACGHVSMDLVKIACKKQGKDLLFHNGFGASGAIQRCVNHLNQIA